MTESAKTKKLAKQINQIRKRLITKAQNQGLWENFGQKDIRKLEDEYFEDMVCGRNPDSNLIREMILNFDEWCSTYNP